ncbi:TetR/AcrR family transcriptional regulator [Nocardia camponoti]|uniref:TetR family transcriptional regulator n=1 Tax=Nocardia camponoti TaxID=1616106 RepID=A0A917QJP0_9NOCA|nr:TetR/AcrR family transcriptional regulator [Nocardia camponoti]GGK54248.1 TetR family transcriptional regulator [Nocardia camponoti]
MTTADRRYGGRTVVARKAERRGRFIEAATRVFAERGYSTCSLAEVCTAAGLSKRQFYEEFQTREDVLIAAYDHIQDEAAAAVTGALAAQTTPPDPELALRLGFAAYLESLATDPYRTRLAFIEVVGVSDRMEEHRRARRHEWSRVIGGLLARLGVRLRGNAELTTGLITGAVNGIAHEWLVGEADRAPVTELVDLLTAVALSLVEPE